MTTLPQRLRAMADHTGLDAVAELLREAADTIERREAVIRILERDALAEQMPIAMKTHGAWDGLELLDGLPDGACLYTAPQPAKRVPLTGVQIRTWWASENGLEDCDMAKLDNFEKVVRSVERTHGITGEQN